MTDMETRLREVSLAEPPLGFDPDDVVTKAAKRQRTRRATVATAVVTLGIAGAAVVALRPSPPPLAPPAATYLPPVIIVKPTPRNPLEQRTLDHLKEALPTVLAGARKILIGGFYSMGGELHPDELTVTLSFLDHEGAGHSLNLGLIGKLTVSRNMVPPAEVCAAPQESRCEKRPDGSTVVLSPRSAVHYRTDGTAVDVSDVGKVYPDDAPALGLPAGPGAAPFADGTAIDERQLIALVTDPGFVAQ
ncbi:hypothetical protein SAMN05421837_108342 [Amycolatopsis pretoriensis]|uniref:Uncharacterized protein n=1 Tax=Amycolatopsis pretoriensis TaxID=218821 RepID=A0A1H5RE01_9PSEU|nr:hypothetical protein [Amycolatopsis pretoriensis]SEF35747.1 hypothetical protein SAMN05421837_108342 [Amycolatopsis pretoriensis]